MQGYNWASIDSALTTFVDDLMLDENRKKSSAVTIIMFDENSRRTHFNANFTSNTISEIEPVL